MSTTFYLLKGMLRVAARGYWYTGGGEKGAFGYYPHLKDDLLPIYSDTQLHGDLLMAANWAKSLGADGALIDRVFGKRGEMNAAQLHIGDLTLGAESRALWRQDRFQIKPRIEIDDQTRSVRDGMLANFEAAWLDGLTLEAPLYVGYFNNSNEVEQARQLLEEAAQFISGFGAFRSRGYGRGTIRIDWDKQECIDLQLVDAPTGSFSYTLESLVNVRNKPVAAEQLQLVASSFIISAEQLRGWFVRSLHEVTGRWPDAEEMAEISFSDLYPSAPDAPAFPPPMTILRTEDDSSIEDCWGHLPVLLEENFAGGEAASAAEDGKTKCKRKPLKAGSFVTAAGTIIKPTTGVRMRNAIENDFRTLDEGGLFVQQYLGAGTIFTGTINFSAPQSSFGIQAYALLTGLKPTINGTLFAAHASPTTATLSNVTSPRLVISTIDHDPARPKEVNESIVIGTYRRYSPALRRPRRNRPVILPGSVLVGSNLPGTVAWPLFGKPLPGSASLKKTTDWKQPILLEPLAGERITWKEITRSQAGILRELLNTDHNRDAIGKFLRDIQDKHVEKNPHSDLSRLYKVLCSILDRDDGIDRLRQQVDEILNYLKTEIWWQNKTNNRQGEAQ